jgi:hypothetical protein
MTFDKSKHSFLSRPSIRIGIGWHKPAYV